MSRIGNAPVEIKDKVEVTFANDVVKVKGPNGELEQWIDPCVKIKIEDGVVTLSRETDHRDHRAKHGLYRALIANMIEGCTTGYEKQLELIGVGFRASNQGQRLELALGFSHPIIFEIPAEVKLETETLKGKNPRVTLKSHDKELLGKIAAKIRGFRRPEPYKGKGVRFIGEHVRRKAGKTAAK